MTTQYQPGPHGEGPMYAAPQKKRRMWPWVVGAAFSLAVLVMACAGIISTSHDHSSPLPHGTPQTAATAPKQAPGSIGEGEWLVGTDVTAGTYKTAGASDEGYPACAWVVRKSDDQNAQVIDVGTSDKVNAPGRVVLKKGQVFETSGCKIWTKQ